MRDPLLGFLRVHRTQRVEVLPDHLGFAGLEEFQGRRVHPLYGAIDGEDQCHLG